MIVINRLLTFLSPMDLLIPVLLFSLISSPFFVEALHAPINTTRTFTAQPPPSFQKQANLGVKSAKVFSFSGNSNAGVAPPLPPLPPQPKAKPWDVRNSYQIPQQGIFPPIQQRKPNVPPSFQRNNQPNQLMPQTFNRNQLLRAGSSGFPAKQQPFIATTPIPTPSPDTLGGSQVRFNFKAAKARQAQLARMRTTSPKPSPPAKKKINTSSFNRFDRFNRFKKPRNKQKFKKPTTPKPEKKYVSGNGVQYTDLSKIAKDGSYMGNQDPLYVYSTTTAPPPTYPPTQPPYQRPYRNNYQNNYYQTTTYGYQYYQTTNNYNYDPYYQGQYQNNNAPYQGNNQQYQGPNNQQYQGNYQGYATTTPYYQDQGYQNQGQYNQGYQNQEGYQYTTPPYYPPAQPNNQAYQNNYGPSEGTQQGGNYPQNYSGNQTYSNYNYPGQDPNAQYKPQPQGPVQNTQYQPPPANQGPPSNQGTNTQYQPPPGNQGSNAPYQPPPGNQGSNTQYQPPPANPAPNAQYQPPSANLAPNTPFQPPPGNQGSNAPYQPPPGNQGSNTQYQPPPANPAPNAQYQPPSANLAPNTPYQPPPGNQGSNAPYQPPPGNQGPNTQYQPPPANQGPNAQYQPPPGNQIPPMNQGPNNQYAPPPGIQGPNTQSLPPTGIQAPINQGPPVNPGANGQYQPPPGSQGVNGQYQPPPGAQGPNTQYRPPSGAQGPPPVQGQSYQPAQPAQPYPPQGNPPYQTNLDQGAQQPQNISSNAPYQYQPGQGYNDNYIPPKSGGAGSSPEQSWVRIDNIMTTVKPPSNERWVQVGSIKPTWTTQSTITVNQNKKVQDTTTRAPPDVAGWSDPAPNPNDINLEIIGDTLIDTPIEITKSLDINMTSKTSANTGSDKPLRGDIQIGNSKDQISINVKDKLVTTKTKETKNKVSQSDANNKSKINKDAVKKSAIKTNKLVPEKAVKGNVTTDGKSNVSSLESNAKLKTDKNMSKDPPKPKTTTTSTTTTSTTTTPKPTTTTPKPTTTTPKPTTTTPKPTTTTPKPTTTTKKPTTTTKKPTTTTKKPTTPKPTTTTPKPTTTTPKPTTTTTPKPTTKKPTTTTTTTTKAPSTTTTTTKRPKVSSMHYKIENQANSQQIKETKPHVSVDVKEKITKQSSTSVKIDTSRMPNSENPTNRILAGKESVSKTDIFDHTKTMDSKTLLKSKTNKSKHKNNIALKNSKIAISTDSKKLKNKVLLPPEKRKTFDLNDKQTNEKNPSKSSRNINRLSKLSTSNINNLSNTSYQLEMKSLNYENNAKIKTGGLNVDKTVSSDIPMNNNQETSKQMTRDKDVVSMDAELVRSFVKLIEHFTALTQPVLSARHPTTNIIGPQNISNTSFDGGSFDRGTLMKTKIESSDKTTILKESKKGTKTKEESRRLPPTEFIKELKSGPRTTPTNIQIIRLSKIEREAQKNYAQRLEKSRMNMLRKQYQRDFKNKLNNVKQDQLNLDSSTLLTSQLDLSKEPRIETKGAIEKLQLNVKSSSLPESLLENVMPLPEISTPPPVPLDLDLLNTHFDTSGISQHNNLVYPVEMREAFEAQVARHLPSTTPDMFAAFDETSLLRSNDIFHVQQPPVTVDNKFLLNTNGRFDFNSNLQPAFQHVDTTQTETIFTIDGKPLRTKTKSKHSFNSKPIDPRKRNKFLHDKRVMEASRQFLQAEKRFGNIHNSNTRERNEVNGLQQNILATLPPTFEKASNNFLTMARNVPMQTYRQQKISVREKQRTYDVPRGNFQVDTQSQNIKLPHEMIINSGRKRRIEMPDKVLNERREFKATDNPQNLFQWQQPKEIKHFNTERGTRRQNIISPPVSNIYQGNGQGSQAISLNTFNSEQVIPDVHRGLSYTVNNEVQHIGEKMNVPELMSPVLTHTETKTYNSHLNNFGNQEQTTTFSEADLLEYLQSGFGPSVAQSDKDGLPVPKNKKNTIVFNTTPDWVHTENQNTGYDIYKVEPQVNDYALFDNMYEGNFVRQRENTLAEEIHRTKTINNKMITKSTQEPKNKAWSSTETSNSDTNFMEKDNKVSNKITSNRQNTKILGNVRRRKNNMGNDKGSQLVPTTPRTSKKINNRFVVGITEEKADKGRMLTSEYVEQSNTITKNQALNDRTSTQQSDKNSRRKIIIKHDNRPVILRKTLVKKIKYVKRKDNQQNQIDYVTQTPEITTTTKSPTINKADIKLPSVTQSPLEIIKEAKKPSTSLLKKFQQMKYLINLIEVAEKEKLKQNDETTINKVKSEKNMKHTELDNENGKAKKISMDQEKSKFSTKVIVTRGNQKDRKITSHVTGLHATTAPDYKQPRNKTTVDNKTVLKGLQTNVEMKNKTMTERVFSKKKKYEIKSYTISTPALGTSRETRTFLSNQKSVPIFHLPRKTKLQIKKPQSQTTVKVDLQTEKSKQHTRKSINTENATLDDSNLTKTSKNSKENEKKPTKQSSFTKINSMKRTNSTSKGKRHKKAKNVSLTEIINMKETRNTLKETKKIKPKQVSFTTISNIKETNFNFKEKKYEQAKNVSLTKVNNLKTSDTSKETKMIKPKTVSFTKISNMKGTNNNLKEKKHRKTKNASITKANNIKTSNATNENKNFQSKQVSFTKITNMRRTSDTSKDKKIKRKQDSLIKMNINEVSTIKSLQPTTSQNAMDKDSNFATKEGMEEIKGKQHKTIKWQTNTPKLSNIGRISGKLEKQKVFSIKKKTVKKTINKSDFKMSKNDKTNISEKNSGKLITKAKNSMISSGERKQHVTVGKTRSQNNNLGSKTIITEGRMANKTEPLNPLNGSKQVSNMRLQRRPQNFPRKKATTAQLIRKMGLTLSKTNRPKQALKQRKTLSIDNIKLTKAGQQNNKIVPVSNKKIKDNSNSRTILKPKRKNKQNLNTLDKTVSIKTASNQTEIKSDIKQDSPFTNKMTRQTVISPFSTNKFSVRTIKNEDSIISFSPVLKTVSIKSNNYNSVKKSNHPNTKIGNEIKGSVKVSQYKNKHRLVETPSSVSLPNKTIKVQNPIVKKPKYQSSARRSQRNETVIMTSNSQKDKMATKFRRTGPIRNLTTEENQLLLTQNNSLMNSVEPSNRHILVKILQFLYSNSSDPTSLETIKQEILSTTSKDQQIIIFDILAAYLGGTPPDNSYLVANNNQSRVQTSAQRGVYVQQKPVLKDSHRYGPPRQDYREPQYDVKAAAVDSHRMNNIGTTVFPPDLTTLPIYPTTKSFWDSLFSFTPTTPYPGNKPGSCPTAFALMFDCHNVCSHDSHCYGRQKCCHGGRGTGCCARPETMDVGFNNLLMPYMMAEGQGQGQGGQNNRFFGEILKKK